MAESLDVNARIKALCQIGEWLGNNKMLDQIKYDEINQIYNYLRPSYLSLYELDDMSEQEVKIRRREIAAMDTHRVSIIYQYCVSKLFS